MAQSRDTRADGGSKKALVTVKNVICSRTSLSVATPFNVVYFSTLEDVSARGQEMDGEALGMGPPSQYP